MAIGKAFLSQTYDNTVMGWCSSANSIFNLATKPSTDTACKLFIYERDQKPLSFQMYATNLKHLMKEEKE